jgi:hypothetical protein
MEGLKIYAKGYCINGDGRPVENKDTQTCASCAADLRKQLRQAARDANKEKKPIAKRSPKRAAEERQYIILCREYLECHPCCEVVECHLKSTQVHHMGGRANNNLLNVDLFLAVCTEHHERITIDSKWALNNGYSILRSV